ncbi:MAG: acyltransferase family protein [Candidatus Gastranaerophilaceae bacterium]
MFCKISITLFTLSKKYSSSSPQNQIYISITHFGCKILTTKLLVFLGEISYSLYLLHILFIKIFRYGGDHLISYVLNIGGFVILVPITAYISYKFYEMPARKQIRKVLGETFNL